MSVKIDLFPIIREKSLTSDGFIRISGIKQKDITKLIGAMRDYGAFIHAGKRVHVEISADTTSDETQCYITAKGPGVLGYLVEDDRIEASRDVIGHIARTACEIGSIITIEGRHKVDASRYLSTIIRVSVEDGDVYIAQEQHLLSAVHA